MVITITVSATAKTVLSQPYESLLYARDNHLNSTHKFFWQRVWDNPPNLHKIAGQERPYKQSINLSLSLKKINDFCK
jgi:hypothetical protein